MKKAIVCVPERSIGASFARLLAAEGHPLLLVARRESRLQDLATELRTEHGVRCEVLAVDLTDPESPARSTKCWPGPCVQSLDRCSTASVVTTTRLRADHCASPHAPTLHSSKPRRNPHAREAPPALHCRVWLLHFARGRLRRDRLPPHSWCR
ncbi:MAG: SDR family NAD(P)-dependent oxidoreductase [Actinobacteria bacterium]|nr:SDR family NAD(P)-dependent oxidoreductase [Actinomycetota bacterium]